MSGAATRTRWTAHAVRRVSGGAARTGDYLAAFRSWGRAAFPSQARIAEARGIAVRTVQRHIAELAAAGLLDVQRHRPYHDPYTGRWRRTTNRYRCRFEKLKPGLTRGDPRPSPRRHFWRHKDASRVEQYPSAAGEAPAPPPAARLTWCDAACLYCDGVGMIEPVHGRGWLPCPARTG
jgi:Helix-turn-helix domain